jgi:hypothetical protein
VSTGRVYISRDVVFDENIFPLVSLHPNAGRRLREEIMLLPETTSPSASNDRGVHTNDQYLHIVHVVDPLQVTTKVSSSQNSGPDSAENSENSTSNNASVAAHSLILRLKSVQNLPRIPPLTSLVRILLHVAVETSLHASRRRGPALLTGLTEIPLGVLIRPRPYVTRRRGPLSWPTPLQPTPASWPPPLQRSPPSCPLDPRPCLLRSNGLLPTDPAPPPSPD